MAKAKIRKRSKNLGNEEIRKIVEILDGWTGKLTWDLLIAAVDQRMFNRYTRQALFKHERIRHAFELRKNNGAEGYQRVKQLVSPQLQLALDRIARLEVENRRLESENNNLLEQFARWAYNAHTRGLDYIFLNRSLPSVSRGQTEK